MRQRKNFLACTPQKRTDPESPQRPRLGLSEPVMGKQHAGSGSRPTDDPGDLTVFTSLCISGLPSPYTLSHRPLVPTAFPFNRPQVSNQNFEIIRITLLFLSSRCLKRINPCPYCTGSKECRLIPGSCQGSTNHFKPLPPLCTLFKAYPCQEHSALPCPGRASAVLHKDPPL